MEAYSYFLQEGIKQCEPFKQRIDCEIFRGNILLCRKLHSH